MILLDTSVLIEIPTNPLPEDQVVGSAIVLAELSFGLHAATNPKEKTHRLHRLYQLRELGYEWLPFDEHAAYSYGTLAAEVTKQRPAHSRSKDIMLAAHAHSLGAALATRNAKDFTLIAHLVEIIEVT
ncbi:MAG: PIN domain-containing protein [Microbacteriaceae bacterium]